jgi:hypothetical protein
MLASYLEYSPDLLGGASLRSFIWLARLPLLDAQCGRGPHQTSARQNIVDGVFHSVRLKIASLLGRNNRGLLQLLHAASLLGWTPVDQLPTLLGGLTGTTVVRFAHSYLP